MKKKSKTQPSAQQIANIAGVSLTLVHRKLAQGKTPRQIVLEAAERERQMLRGLPTVPVTNGHAAAATLVSYSEAQRRRECAMARIREAEADVKTGALMPMAEAVEWLRHIFIPLVSSLRGIPQEMADLLGPGVTALLVRRIEGIVGSASVYWETCRAPKPLADGALDCPGGYRVVWTIIPPPVEPPEAVPPPS